MTGGWPVVSGSVQDTSSDVRGLLALRVTVGAAGAAGGSATSVTVTVRFRVTDVPLAESATVTVRAS